MALNFSHNNPTGRNPFNSLVSLLILAGVFVAMFFVIRGFVTLLYWVAPVLLIITLFINYRVVANYALGLVDLLKRNILWGVAKIAFTVVLYPFVIGWLFMQAMMLRRLDSFKKEFEHQFPPKESAQYADYEEISSESVEKAEDAEPIPFKLLPPTPKEKDGNPYNDLFKS